MGQIDEIIKKLNKLSLPTVILIASLVIGYFSYQKGVEIGNAEGIKEGMRIEREYYNDGQEKLNSCLEEAKNKRQKRWQGQCKALGKELDENGSCLIPKGPAEHYDSEYNNDRDFCLKLYK